MSVESRYSALWRPGPFSGGFAAPMGLCCSISRPTPKKENLPLNKSTLERTLRVAWGSSHRLKTTAHLSAAEGASGDDEKEEEEVESDDVDVDDPTSLLSRRTLVAMFRLNWALAPTVRIDAEEDSAVDDTPSPLPRLCCWFSSRSIWQTQPR